MQTPVSIKSWIHISSPEDQIPGEHESWNIDQYSMAQTHQVMLPHLSSKFCSCSQGPKILYMKGLSN